MSFFQEVNNVDIVSLIEKHVSLKRSGSNFIGLCPFHNEKSGSFVVKPKSNIWHCYGCGEGHSAIDFVMKFSNKTAWEAACEIANDNGIEIPELTDEYKETQSQKQKLYDAINVVQRFFIEKLKATDAKKYLLTRWEDKIISDWGFGYAPDGFELVEFCKINKITDESVSLGLLKKSEKGVLYSYFRDRITIPVHDKNHRLIGFTARTYRDNKDGVKEAKYINSAESIIFSKSKVLFGLNRAYRNIQDKKRLYLVEGNADVISLHAIGKVGTICTMGTSITKDHVDEIKKLNCLVVIIGDTDNAGIKAVHRTAKLLIESGISVSVVTIIGEDPDKKEDPDSFFKSKSSFNNYVSENINDYIIQEVKRNIDLCENNIDYKTKFISEVAKMISFYDDVHKRNNYIEEVSKWIKPKTLWKNALKTFVSSNMDDEDFIKNRIPKNITVAEVERWGFYINDGKYFFQDKNGFHEGSNFVLTPLFHISSTSNAKRLFQMTNEYGFSQTIEIDQKDMISLNGFKLRVESLGNFRWDGSESDMNKLKKYLYEKTESCVLVEQLGWHKNGFWAWGNGLFADGKFLKSDSYGIATFEGVNYYLPAGSIIYSKEDTLFVFERKFIHREKSIEQISFNDYAAMLINCFGDNAKIGLCFYFASLFSDYIYKLMNFFPILNLFGPKGTGKTEMAHVFLHFFGPLSKGPNMTNSTIAALSSHISTSSNSLCHIDEYKNSVEYVKIEFLKGLWDRTGRTRMNMDKDKKTETTAVDNAIMLTGQEMPTADIAMFTRLVFLSFTQTEYSQQEKDNLMKLHEVMKKGITHLTHEVLLHRKWVIDNYLENYNDTIKDMGQAVDMIIEDRIMRNWCVILSAFRVLEAKIKLPFSYRNIIHVAAEFIKRQNAEVKKGSEVSIFWNIFTSLIASGEIHEKVDYKIVFLSEVATDKGTPTFSGGREILYLRKERVFQLYRKHGNMTKENILPLKTLEYYLGNSPGYLGNKVVSFKRSYEESDFANTDSVVKNNISTSAMVFDYEKTGLQIAVDGTSDDEYKSYVRGSGNDSAEDSNINLFKKTKELPF